MHLHYLICVPSSKLANPMKNIHFPISKSHQFYIPKSKHSNRKNHLCFMFSHSFRHASCILCFFSWCWPVFFRVYVIHIHVLKSCLACQHILSFFLNKHLLCSPHSVHFLRFGIVSTQLTVIQFQE